MLTARPVLTHINIFVLSLSLSLTMLSTVQAANVDLYSALPDNMFDGAVPTKYTFILKMDVDLAVGSVITLETTKAFDGLSESQSIWTGNGDADCAAQAFTGTDDQSATTASGDLTGAVFDQGKGCTTTSDGADRTHDNSGCPGMCNNKAGCTNAGSNPPATWTPERLVLTVANNPLLAGKRTDGKGTRTIVCTSKLAANPGFGGSDISLATVANPTKTVSTCDGQNGENLCNTFNFRTSRMSCGVCIQTGTTNTPDQCTVTGCVLPLVTDNSDCAGYPCTQAEFGGASSTCCYLPPQTCAAGFGAGTCRTTSDNADRTSSTNCGSNNAVACNSPSACVASADSPATWTPGPQACGATKKYDSDNAALTCATSSCSGTTAGDVTKCCKTVQTCAQGFGPAKTFGENCEDSLGVPQVYDSTKASLKCLGNEDGGACRGNVDTATCCKANPPQTCGASNFASDTTWCGSTTQRGEKEQVYDTTQANTPCARNPCETDYGRSPDIAACCMDAPTCASNYIQEAMVASGAGTVQGDSITFTCDSGYAATKSGVATCQSDGTWTGGRCVEPTPPTTTPTSPARTLPMSDADVDTLVATLTSYTAMYDRINSQVLEAVVSTTAGKGLGFGVGYCTKVAEAFVDLQCSAFDQSTCTSEGEPSPCCKGNNEKVTRCNDVKDDWRLDEAKKFMSNAGSNHCCPDCLLGKNTGAYKASCTAKDYVTFTVCGTDGRNDGSDPTYKPGPPIAFKTDCSTGPDRVLTGQKDEEVNGEKVYTCKTTQATFDTFYKQYQATGYKDLSAMTTAERTAWSGLQSYSGPMGEYWRAVVSGAADSTKPSLTMSIADDCIGLLGSATLGPSTLAVKKGTAYIYDPTVLTGAKITVAPQWAWQTIKVWILAGSSEGTVTVTNPGARSSFYIHGFTNGKAGDVSVTGCSDVFLSSVINKGTVVVTDTIGTAINIVNEGDIKIKGKSNINLVLTSNTGTIEFDDDAKGTIDVPSDQMGGIKAPTSVTVTNTVAKSPSSEEEDGLGDTDNASAAVLASGALAMVLVAASLMF